MKSLSFQAIRSLLTLAALGLRSSDFWHPAQINITHLPSQGERGSSFDTDGKVITAVGSNDHLASAVKVQADGKIVVVGSSLSAQE